MRKTQQHLSDTKHRVSEVQDRIDSIEGHGREVEKSPLAWQVRNVLIPTTSLLSIQKNEGLTWR